MAKSKDFFISYNKADRFWAAGIREWLLSAGKTVVMQDPDFQPGSNFVIEMHEALKSAKRMLSVLSQDYLESRFCSSEWAAKFAEDPTGADRLLLMVKVRDCKLEGLLKQIVYLDLTGLTIEAAETSFLAAIAERSGPPTKPEAPGREKKSEKAKRAPKGDTIIKQKSTGHNSVNIGVQNINTPRYSVRNEIKPGPEHITPAQRTIINDRLKELGDREAFVAIKKKFPDGPTNEEEEELAKDITSKCFQYLRGDFNRDVNDGQSYHLLPLEKFDEALTWIAQRKAIKRSSLRRTDNELWRRDYERVIWGGMRDRRWQKQDVYDFALKKAIVTTPITSLKELGEQKLQALANAIRVKKSKRA